ncbi:MAG: LLM class flavin-dependent oxidoreductase [Candidatus Lokiarchaeota archaeon]|nr:LLM class flavin-dependent oxidoreductase [Candidatus Lokiarchaeota archaeon]
MLVDLGIQIEPQFGFSFQDVKDIAKFGRESGFSTIWFSDHFMLDKDATDRELLDPWLLMTALVTIDQDIRVGSLVFCNSYRHPPLHAKMGATLDVLSNGRLEFGIGAGWKELEYNAYGYPFPSDSTRIDQLAEAVQIIKGIWTSERFSYEGDHYQIRDLISYPKPIQEPHPSVWIGSMKAGDRLLELTARYGDGINLAWAYSPSFCQERFELLDEMIETSGRNPSEVKRSIGLWTRVFDSEKDMDSAIKENALKRGIEENQYRDRVASALWGTPESIAERLREYKDIGVSDIILMFPHGEEIEYIKRFEKIIDKV